MRVAHAGEASASRGCISSDTSPATHTPLDKCRKREILPFLTNIAPYKGFIPIIPLKS